MHDFSKLTLAHGLKRLLLAPSTFTSSNPSATSGSYWSISTLCLCDMGTNAHASNKKKKKGIKKGGT